MEKFQIYKNKKTNFLQILYPKTCPVCDKVLVREQEICMSCVKKLIPITEPKCKKCGKYLGKQENAFYQEYCPDCKRMVHYFQCGVAVFVLNQEMRQSIYRFKYKNHRTYADFYGMAISYYYGRQLAYWGAEVLLPVPLHKKKKRQRGFNQTELIANVVGEQLNIPVDRDLLIRVKNTVPQKELNPTERHNNLKKAFQITKNLVQYKKVVLVDDIYTTGSTIDACAEVLLQAGVQKVYFISLSIGAGI